MMIVTRQFEHQLVLSDVSVIEAMRKSSDNKERVLYCISEGGYLEGVVTGGDFQRWIIAQTDLDLNTPVSAVCQRKFKFARQGDSPKKIASQFTDRIDQIPILNDRGIIVALALRQEQAIRIGTRVISDASPAFVIAEIGNNHNGSLAKAKEMVHAAAEAGADCVKFQMRNLKTLYANEGNPNDAREDLGSQYVLSLLSRFQLTVEEFEELFAYCRSHDILALCTPWDVSSLGALEGFGLGAYKIASADMTNLKLLEAAAATGKPLIASTGMSTEVEIRQSVEHLRRHAANFALLHTNSTYPAPYKDINLRFMQRLKEIGQCIVGYSGHELGINVAVAAVALGAKIVEKHFTFDRSLEGNDHRISLMPDEFKAMVEGIRQIEAAADHIAIRRISQGEMMNRENLAKSIVAARAIKSGESIAEDMIEIKSPGKGLQPNRLEELLGRKTVRSFEAGDFFFPSDLGLSSAAPRDFKFGRPWGLPVRYHDYRSILKRSNPKLLEFHLSFHDLSEKVSKYFAEPMDMDLVVHSPEIFENDHLLDLCTPDPDVRQESIRNMQRVVDVARALKPYFKRAGRVLIVTNVGGFSLKTSMPPEKRESMYRRLSESLAQVDQDGVEIIPQTMPPFPWLFGGQRFHNLFVDPDEIAQFCKRNKMRICLDVSHSQLACNQNGWYLSKFVRTVGPYVAHLHIVDAAGVDDEGLQIGDGEIDFAGLGRYLKEFVPSAGFIPEIWQGHKNNGEGFWLALDRLEPHF
jgi:sialic acid synthase SpsE/sugar phosphate isomerase/epimerase